MAVGCTLMALLALLLQRQGCRVSAAYMKNWINEDNVIGECPWQQDIDDARRFNQGRWCFRVEQGGVVGNHGRAMLREYLAENGPHEGVGMGDQYALAGKVLAAHGRSSIRFFVRKQRSAALQVWRDGARKSKRLHSGGVLIFGLFWLSTAIG